MRPALRRPSIGRLALLLSLALALASGPAAAQGHPAPGRNQAFLYELSENAVLRNEAGHDLAPDPDTCPLTQLVDPQTGQCAVPVRRVATSELQGVAASGTPLCPEVLITDPKLETCTVTATGMSDISLTPDPITGDLVGSLSGRYAVVIQLDNPTDSPEWPQQTGTFSGTIHFRTSLPLGFTTGATLTINGVSGSFPFDATFRQPFAMGPSSKHVKARRGQRAFYLVDDERVPVQPDERAVGWPTVRFEINF